MNTTDFFVTVHNSKDVIHDKNGDEILIVYNLTGEAPILKLDQNHFYGDDHGDELVFETFDKTKFNNEIYMSAIRWYARYLDYPQMEIRATF